MYQELERTCTAIPCSACSSDVSFAFAVVVFLTIQAASLSVLFIQLHDVCLSFEVSFTTILDFFVWRSSQHLHDILF